MVSNHDRIEELIGQAQDPTLRGLLMLFVKLSNQIDDNTRITGEIVQEMQQHRKDFVHHTEAFDKHVRDEHAMLASARGAWWASTVLVGCIAALGFYILSGFATSLATATATVQDIVIRVRVLETALNRDK